MADEHKTVELVAPGIIKAVLPSAEPAKVGDAFAAPVKTEEESRVTQGQRDINRLWESTQAGLATLIVRVVVVVSAVLSLIPFLPWAVDRHMAIALAAFTLLSTIAGTVIGFYFGRTNHQRTGGVGGSDAGR